MEKIDIFGGDIFTYENRNVALYACLQLFLDVEGVSHALADAVDTVFRISWAICYMNWTLAYIPRC